MKAEIVRLKDNTLQVKSGTGYYLGYLKIIGNFKFFDQTKSMYLTVEDLTAISEAIANYKPHN